MGCVVNGPGEAKDCDLGIAGAKDYCVIFKNGEIERKVAAERAEEEFFKEINDTFKMSGKILEEIRAVSKNLNRAIIRGVTLERAEKRVTVAIVTDEAFTPADERGALAVIKNTYPTFSARKLK